MLGGGINIWIAAVALLPRNDNIDPAHVCAEITIAETNSAFSVDSGTKFILESLKERLPNIDAPPITMARPVCRARHTAGALPVRWFAMSNLHPALAQNP